MEFGKRRNLHWDSSDVLVELTARALEDVGWRILTASSRAEKAYPTGDGQTIFPDIVAFNGCFWIFTEVKSRLFLIRDLSKEHISYHFAPAPRCRDAFSSLARKAPRDTGACEMQRLVKACSIMAGSTDKGLTSVVVPSYVVGWKLAELILCLEELNASLGTAVELWILNRRNGKMSLMKKIARQGTPDVPTISDRIANEVAQEFGISFLDS